MTFNPNSMSFIFGRKEPPKTPQQVRHEALLESSASAAKGLALSERLLDHMVVEDQRDYELQSEGIKAITNILSDRKDKKNRKEIDTIHDSIRATTDTCRKLQASAARPKLTQEDAHALALSPEASEKENFLSAGKLLACFLQNVCAVSSGCSLTYFTRFEQTKRRKPRKGMTPLKASCGTLLWIMNPPQLLLLTLQCLLPSPTWVNVRPSRPWIWLGSLLPKVSYLVAYVVCACLHTSHSPTAFAHFSSPGEEEDGGVPIPDSPNAALKFCEKHPDVLKDRITATNLRDMSEEEFMGVLVLCNDVGLLKAERDRKSLSIRQLKLMLQTRSDHKGQPFRKSGWDKPTLVAELQGEIRGFHP